MTQDPSEGSRLVLPPKPRLPALVSIRSPADAETVVAFIHGLGGDCYATWGMKNEPGTFLTRLAEDLPAVAIATYGYNSLFFSRLFALPSRLRVEALARVWAGKLREDLLGRYRTVAVVCHSLGGIVTQAALRELITNQPLWAERLRVGDTRLVLFLMGVPQHGTTAAKGAGAISDELRVLEYNGDLVRTNTQFWNSRVRQPEDATKDEHLPIEMYAVVSETDAWVPQISAGGSLDEAHVLRVAISHTELVKPPRHGAFDAYDFVLSRLRQRLSVQPARRDDTLRSEVAQLLGQIRERFQNTRLLGRRPQSQDLGVEYIQPNVAPSLSARDRLLLTDHSGREGAHDRQGGVGGSVPWDEAKRFARRAVVLGDAGMGKTTLLRLEAWSLARTQQERLSQNEVDLDQVELPLNVSLPKLSGTADELADALLEDLAKEHPGCSSEVLRFVRSRLERGGCLLLFDDLDRVPGDELHELGERLERFFRAYPCRCIFVSRIVGYPGPPLEAVQEFRLTPMVWSQTRKFVTTRMDGLGAEKDRTLLAETLLVDLRQRESLVPIRENPLLLAIVCRLFAASPATSSPNLVDLYRTAVDDLLGLQPNEQRPERQGRVIAKKRLLERVAFGLAETGKLVIATDKLYEAVEQADYAEFRDEKPSKLMAELAAEDGLLTIAMGEEGYEFIHRTFQEFLVACYLLPQLATDAAIAEFVGTYSRDPAWSETLRFLCGLAPDATALVRAILNEEDDAFSSSLLLAGSCVAHARRVDSSVADPVLERIESMTKSGSETADRPHAGDRFRAASVLVRVLARQSPQRLEELLVDNIASPMARELVEAMGAAGDPRLGRRLLALAERGLEVGTDVHCQILWTLAGLRTEGVIPYLEGLVTDGPSELRETAANCLGALGGDEEARFLLETLSQASGDRLRAALIRAIGRTASASCGHDLFRMLLDESTEVSDVYPLALALRDIGDARLSAEMSRHLNDASIRWEIRWLITIAIERPIGSCTPALLELLESPRLDERVKFGISVVLVKWGIRVDAQLLWLGIEQRKIPADFSFGRKELSVKAVHTAANWNRLLRLAVVVDPEKTVEILQRRLKEARSNRQKTDSQLQLCLSGEEREIVSALRGLRSEVLARVVVELLQLALGTPGDEILAASLGSLMTKSVLPEVCSLLPLMFPFVVDEKDKYVGVVYDSEKLLSFVPGRSVESEVTKWANILSAIAAVADDENSMQSLGTAYAKIPKITAEDSREDLDYLRDVAWEALYDVSRRSGVRVHATEAGR